VTWLRLMRAGDWLVVVAGLVAVAALADRFWRGGPAAKAQIRANGEVVIEVDLAIRKEFRIAGPLGETVVEIDRGRARVKSDPGPRQYCVQQGWLSRAGDIAICAPNRVSLAVAGAELDSTAY
jgi:hypothetical protein